MTAYETFSNNTTTTVTSGGTTAPAGGTSESWTVASSASFPAAATGVSWFHVADPNATSEKILVTNVSGTTWTVTRGAESTTPVTHSAGFTVNQVVTAGWLASAMTLTGTGTGIQVPGTTPAIPVVMAPVAWCFANDDSGTAEKPLTSYTYANGTAGVGATVTHNSNGVLSVDGGSPAVNDRVLLLDPYAGGTGNPPHPDGIYTVTSAGSVSTPWVLTRSTDNNTAATLGQFWAVAITNGTLFGGGWAQVCALNDVQGVQSFVVGTSFPGFSVAAESAFSSGPWNTASGFSSAALGTQASATGQNSVAVGNTATATGIGSHGYGPYSTSNGQYAVSLGYESFANGRESVALGAFSVAYSNGQLSEASNFNNVKGDAQGTRAYPCQTTTNATPANLVLAFGTQVKFQDSGQNDDFGKTMLVKYTVVARRTDTPGTDSAWTAQGVLRGNGTNAYTWIGGTPPAFTVVAQDAGASTWAVATSVSSNTLSVTVTGQAAKTIDWTALVETTEAA